MFMKLGELFDDDNDDDENFEKKVSKKLDLDSLFEINSDSTGILNQSKTIDDIASNLCSIDIDQIIDLPRTVFYSILTSDKLTIESEDWLLDLIDKFTSTSNEKLQFSMDDGLSDIYFYEEVNFDFLSEDKFKEFIEKFDPNEMTVSL